MRSSKRTAHPCWWPPSAAHSVSHCCSRGVNVGVIVSRDDVTGSSQTVATMLAIASSVFAWSSRSTSARS